MYECQKCGRMVSPRIRQRMLVVSRRDRTYVNEKGETSQGWEVAKEIAVCPDCVENR